MSGSPESPERLAQVLLEILALSDSARINQSKTASGGDRLENFDAHRIEEQSKPTKEEDNAGQ